MSNENTHDDFDIVRETVPKILATKAQIDAILDSIETHAYKMRVHHRYCDGFISAAKEIGIPIEDFMMAKRKGFKRGMEVGL